MREWVADKLSRALVLERDGKLYPPGALTGARFVQKDMTEIAVVSRGDSIELLHGRSEFHGARLSPDTALKLAWFLLWRYWFVGTWCGIKTSAWRWTLEVKLDEIAETNRRARAKAKTRSPH